MNTQNEASAPVTRLADYRPPAWQVETVELEFELGIHVTEVLSRLRLRRDPAQQAPLRLDGEGLELLSIMLDGQPLGEDRYRQSAEHLEVDGAADGSVLETRVRIRPSANTALEGLYVSGSPEQGFLLTQCEAEGFRHITFFPDRPDVQSRFSVTLRADRARFPVLLAGGNPDGSGELADGRHWARFVDPHPRPSYLFALVAGSLSKIERDYRTADGRDVQLKIWAEADVVDSCHYALDALERSMRWDEATYGRNYDLDVFHIVATHDFNMGAMENKGLNIFNSKYLLADPDTATDDEYRAVEAVVAHEYFHNWSGNRVTCRDWFQLSLKEGLTVFREHQFSADMNSAPLKRIEDVAVLRRAQFPEDAGPLSHPVRPAQYREINNFYTATVYEKGAELVRMLAGTLGEAGFRRGMDRYFERNDGRAATIEDFIDALGTANGVDLTPYLAWYAQSGTPRLRAHGRYDAAKREYHLTLGQQLQRREGKPAAPLPIPVKLALFGDGGQMIDLHLDVQTAESKQPSTAPAVMERVVVLDRAEQTFVFRQVDAVPVPSLLRGFSAPVILECDYTPDELARLLLHDPDGFNRWEAGQRLASRAFAELHAQGAVVQAGSTPALDSWSAALAAVFEAERGDDALLAELLNPPGEIELAEQQDLMDPARIHASRQELQKRLALRIGGAALTRRYETLARPAPLRLDAAQQAQRRLKRRVLELLSLVDRSSALALMMAQYESANGMTDRLAAVAVLVRSAAPQMDSVLQHYRTRYAAHALAMDKWFAVQTQLPGEPALARIQQLEHDPAFSWKNPNRVQSLADTFVRGNLHGFHRADGAGYRWLAERLIGLDALNPQVAARLAKGLNGWRRLEPVRREAARTAIVSLAGQPGLSRNLAEIAQTMASD